MHRHVIGRIFAWHGGAYLMEIPIVLAPESQFKHLD